MCGEIEDWQIAKQVNVRLVGGGGRQNINLNGTFANVEEIRVTEVLFTNFNGGVSAGAYLNVHLNGLHPGCVNNEPLSGTLLMCDVLNPHVVYQNPRVVARANQISLNQFGLSIVLPTGAPLVFTEACITLVFVCRRTADEIAEVRRMKALMHYPPSILDGAARNTYNPDFQ
jgi:hypothetical protein